jgi:chemotaxis protein MotB
VVLDEEEYPPRSKAPSWVITFADLMSLLMCFFVLLLSYSEMDAKKFEQIAASLSQSLGTPSLEAPIPAPIVPLPLQAPEAAPPEPPLDEDAQASLAIRRKLEALVKETQADAQRLEQVLQAPIAQGELEIETQGRNIIVRLREKGSFDSGSADLHPGSLATLEAVKAVLATKPGSILVQGHTDDVPISTARFRSNWELSSVRAVAVAEALMRGGQVAPERFEVTGLAQTRPLAANTTAAQRARNRRVDIVISQDIDAALTEQDKQQLQNESGGRLLRSLQLRPKPKPGLPDNIF